MAGENYQAIVLGAGMAGLTAGRALAEQGMRVLMVEARDRVGGRILTHHAHGETMELGAQFVHGKPPRLWELIGEADVDTYELSGKQFCWHQEDLRQCGSDFQETMQWMEKLKTWGGGDCSFAEYMDRANIPHRERGALIDFVEGFNAADHRVIGVASLATQQAAEDATEGDRLFCIRGGYSQLPEFLARKFVAAGGKLLLSTCVEAVEWTPGSVKIHCRHGAERESFQGSCAVIAFPLGVLQSGSVQFSPTAEAMRRATERICMGHVRRVTLLFRERFWEKLRDSAGQQRFECLSFMYRLPSALPTWWTQVPENSSSITAWVGGPRADALAEWSWERLECEALGALSKMFAANTTEVRDLLVQADSHDWQRDPFSRGAYSYLPVGGVSAAEQMAVPVESTLFFAGEHTEMDGNWGTVHAAIHSGIRAAEQIMLRNDGRKTAARNFVRRGG